MPNTSWNRHHILSLADFSTIEYNAVLQTAASFARGIINAVLKKYQLYKDR